MKKIIHISIVFLCIMAMGACTNDEDDDKIDILTPTTDATGTAQTILDQNEFKH